MAGPVARVAGASVLPMFFLLVLAVHPGVDWDCSGDIAWVLPRRHSAAGDLDAMAKLRFHAGRLNCEHYRQVLTCAVTLRCPITEWPCHVRAELPGSTSCTPHRSVL